VALALLASPLGAGTALGGAYGAFVRISAPSTVAFGATYTVTVSGLAPGKANMLVAFEGGSAIKALRCYPQFAVESRRFPTLERTEQYSVHGRFADKTFGFVATHAGPKGFCAYVINSKAPGGPSTFVHGQATWTVS
jgi:hypothetical protein